MIAEFMAREIGVESGKLIFHSKNCHIYERQYKLVDELLNIKSTHFDLIKESMKKPQDLNNKVT
jgi:thymidylate synthase